MHRMRQNEEDLKVNCHHAAMHTGSGRKAIHTLKVNCHHATTHTGSGRKAIHTLKVAGFQSKLLNLPV